MRPFLLLSMLQAVACSPIEYTSSTASAIKFIPRSDANGIPVDTSYPTLNITMTPTGNTNVTITMANHEHQDILISSWFSILYPGTEAKGLFLYDGDKLVGNGPSQKPAPIFPPPTSLDNFTDIAQGTNLTRSYNLTQIFNVTHSGDYILGIMPAVIGGYLSSNVNTTILSRSIVAQSASNTTIHLTI